MKPSSEKRLQQLHPALAAAVRKMAVDLAGQGIAIEVVQGLRTFAEQDALFAQGRTRPGAIVTQAKGGESNHNYGLAADVCPFVNDKPDWNAAMPVWAAIGAAAATHGLDWGGAWKKFLDKPHVELKSMTLKECQTCFKSGGIDQVWKTASTRVGWVDPAAPAAAAPVARGLGIRVVAAAKPKPKPKRKPKPKPKPKPKAKTKAKPKAKTRRRSQEGRK